MEEASFPLRSETVLDTPKDLDREKWSKSLKVFVKKLIFPIMSRPPRRGKSQEEIRRYKEREVQKYLTPRSMETWEAAFTHPSFDIRPEYNYEKLEFIGDRVLKYAFNKYIMRRFPELDEDALTGVETTYMAKDFQPQYSRKLGLDKYVVLVGMDRASTDIQEDLFESFIGALSNISDDIEDGLGAVNVYNFIVWFFNKYKFDLEGALGGKAKTLVRQIFERFDKSMLEGIHSWIMGDDGVGTFTVKATPKIMEFLSSKEPGKGFGVTLRSPILGQAKGYAEKKTGKKAYQQALKTLESYGITPTTAKLMKNMQDFMHPSILPYKPMLEKRMKEDGYKFVYFDSPNALRTKVQYTIMLMAEDELGKPYQLGSITIPKGSNDIEAKEHLLKNYLYEERVSKRAKPQLQQKRRVIIKSPVKSSSKEPETTTLTENIEEQTSVELNVRKERKQELQKLKVTDLKKILRDKGLKISGNKSELIERILNDEFQ